MWFRWASCNFVDRMTFSAARGPSEQADLFDVGTWQHSVAIARYCNAHDLSSIHLRSDIANDFQFRQLLQVFN